MRRPEASPLASFLRSTSPPPFRSWVPGGILGRGREGLSKAEVMRADVAASGGGALPGFLGTTKNRYARVDDVLPHEPNDGAGVRVCGKGGTCRRYIFACSVFSVFASLNHVLHGHACPDVGVMSACIVFIQNDLHITECSEKCPSLC